ncbi:MAG: alpha/beta fold hydrolase [Proteobacteria bacterium]|nr:alpha/beta fold hydrolase [Pseudomonadota bacterium]
MTGNLPSRHVSELQLHAESRTFRVDAHTRVVALCNWQPDRHRCPTLILLHGLTADANSTYIVRTASTAWHQGCNIVRLNMRNCGGTEALTPTLYHSGLTEDLRAVATELGEQDGLSPIILLGFSMGGNIVLKLSGELGEHVPRWLVGAVAVSPPVQLAVTSAILHKPANRHYSSHFFRGLRAFYKRKAALFPDRYSVARLRGLRCTYDFDDHIIAPNFGFDSADHYHECSSSLQYVPQIRLPTLILAADDDPFIPVQMFQSAEIRANADVVVDIQSLGGHLGFQERTAEDGSFRVAERVVRFVAEDLGFASLISGNAPGSVTSSDAPE